MAITVHSKGMLPSTTSGSESGVPVGTIIDSMSSVCPPGFLTCDGLEVGRLEYPELFAVIGTSCGHGDGVTTFNKPFGDGKFKRGTNNGSGNDPDAASRQAQAAGGNTGDQVGSVQGDQIRRHAHGYHKFYNNTEWASNAWNTDESTGDETNQYWDAVTTQTGGNETRPNNFNVNFYIKY